MRFPSCSTAPPNGDRQHFAFHCDLDSAQQAALQADLGVGAMQIALARRNPDLVLVLAEQIHFKLDVWLAVHRDQRDQPAIRTVLNGLAEGLGKLVATSA